MARVRIVLAGLPELLAGIVRATLAPQTDLEIVAEVATRAELACLLAATPAAVAVVGLAPAEPPDACAELLRAHPGLRILALTLDGRRAYQCEMRLHVSVMTELSVDGLLAALLTPVGVDRDLHLFSPDRPIPAADRTSDN